LKRKYFFAVPGKKDWSGKPGFRRFAPEMRPNFQNFGFGRQEVLVQLPGFNRLSFFMIENGISG
jgi:hypothetical protein